MGRPELLAALDTAAALATTTRHRRIHLAASSAGAEVSIYADSGALLHHTPLPGSAWSGPTPTLTFQPALLHQAVAFLDGTTVAVGACPARLAVYLHSGNRHAIVMQTAA